MGRAGLRALSGALGLVTLIGCSETSERPACQDPLSVGLIVGEVCAAGSAVEADVIVIDTAEPDRLALLRHTDAAGRFAFAVPAGAYWLWAVLDDGILSYAADGAVIGLPGDTLRVAAGDTVVVNFPLGRLAVDVAVEADELEGWSMWLTCEGEIGEAVRWRASARDTVRDGAVRFELTALPPGRYSLLLGRGGSWLPPQEDLWLPGTHDPEAADKVEVVAGATVAYGAELPREIAGARGRVTGSWQAMGLDPPLISFFADDSLLILENVPVGPEGEFRSAFLVPERIRVSCTIEGSTRWIGGADYAHASEFALTAGTETDLGAIEEGGLLLELIEQPPWSSGGFELRLVSADTGLPIQRRLVARSGRTNLYPFANLDPGTYLLHVCNASMEMNWSSQWFDRAATPGGAAPIVLPGGGAVVPVTVTLERGGSISGRVMNQSEATPPYFAIYVSDPETRATVGRVWQETSRVDCEHRERRPFNFTARGLADGAYRVGAYADETCLPPSDAPEGTVWFPGTTEWEEAESVSVTGHAAVSGIEITWALE